MKIRYKPRIKEDISINKPGSWVVSCVSGKTRVKGNFYKVIPNPKTQKIDKDFMWFLSEKGWPCKISNAKINSFRLPTKDELEQLKTEKDAD